jgi:hypothetical protein
MNASPLTVARPPLVGRWIWPALGLLLAALFVSVLLPTTLRARSIPGGPVPFAQVWMATPGTIKNIEGRNASLAARFFNAPTSFGLNGGWGGATPALSWASEADFARSLATGSIPSHVHTVMYDPEFWPATPLEEQQHPILAMHDFATAAHAAGYAVVITPHPSLAEVDGGPCGASEAESVEDAFLGCGLQGVAARFADVVEIQAQFLEWDPMRYRRVVETAAAQARAANPNVIVLAGLSTRFASDADVMYQAWDAVRDVVDGHYLAMPEGIRPEVATGFLTMVVERSS